MADKIRVLTVDDSSLMQKLLKSALSQSDNIELVGQAMDSAEARNMIKSQNPDIITLDVEMPGMNGLEFLERLMNARPMPVIMFSSHTAEGTEITLKALELGAVDFLQKPRVGLDKSLDFLVAELLPKILSFGKAKPRTLRDALVTMNKSSEKTEENKNKVASAQVKYDFIAIGASTGGVTAIREVLEGLPGNLPPIVITQHMPEGYTARFADRLNRDCSMTVVQASNAQELKSGHCYIAPGTHHMKIASRGGKFFTELSDGAPVSGHRPSVDVMFSSLAKAMNNGRAVAVMLTGMGRDGAEGMLQLRNLGCPTIGQNKETCVVYGMPRAAFEAGAIDIEVPLDGIASAVLDVLCGASVKSLGKNTTKRKAV